MTALQRRLGSRRLVLALVALVLIVLAWWGILAEGRGLTSRALTGAGGVPLTFIAPEGATGAPGVVIAHGFAGSSRLMLGFGRALAHGGYGVMLLDFDGHGAARGPLDSSALQRNLLAAAEALAAQPEIDPTRLALLGHSMGSGAVMTAGITTADRYRATIAVSPTGAEVSPDAPRNLLLMAGSLEPNFVGNARDLLARAGGENDDLAGGRGRALLVVPNVEHITILFSRTAQTAALDWLDRAFGLPGGAVAGPDRRLVWYATHLGGWLLLLLAAAPLVPAATAIPAARRRPWAWLGLPVGALAAGLALAALGRMGDFTQLGGLLVGGVLALWFAVLGLVWLGLLSGFRRPRPTGRDALWGLLLFAVLTVAFGLMADRVWIHWWLVPARLARWPFLAAAALPWLLAAGRAQAGASPWRRAGWWLWQTAVIVAGLALAIVVYPGLGFVSLLMPIIPIILLILSAGAAAFVRPWSFALGGALFFGWLLVAVFPLA